MINDEMRVSNVNSDIESSSEPEKFDIKLTKVVVHPEWQSFDILLSVKIILKLIEKLMVFFPLFY